jgi:hypothetical protein
VAVYLPAPKIQYQTFGRSGPDIWSTYTNPTIKITASILFIWRLTLLLPPDRTDRSRQKQSDVSCCGHVTPLPPKGIPAAPSNRDTCTAGHFPTRAAGMPRSSRPAAMARSDSQPAACSSLIVGGRSVARLRTRSCTAALPDCSCHCRQWNATVTPELHTALLSRKNRLRIIPGLTRHTLVLARSHQVCFASVSRRYRRESILRVCAKSGIMQCSKQRLHSTTLVRAEGGARHPRNAIYGTLVR